MLKEQVSDRSKLGMLFIARQMALFKLDRDEKRILREYNEFVKSKYEELGEERADEQAGEIHREAVIKVKGADRVVDKFDDLVDKFLHAGEGD